MFGTMPRNSPLGPSASPERGVITETPLAAAAMHANTRAQTHRHTDTRTHEPTACVRVRAHRQHRITRRGRDTLWLHILRTYRQ